MMDLLNLAALAAACFVFYTVAFERIRHINWRTTKPTSVAMYVLLALWALGTLYFAFGDQVHIYQLAGLAAVILFLHVTKDDWKDGAPEKIKTDFGKLAEVEAHHSVQ